VVARIVPLGRRVAALRIRLGGAPVGSQRFKSQIAPIEFKKVEGAEMHVSKTAAQPLEICKAAFVAGAP
jgi:hypothetical protein